MQSIDKQQSHRSAVVLAPAQELPAVFKARVGRVVVQANHQWVLHRVLAIRIIAALIIAGLATIGFQARGGITMAAMGTGDLLSGRFASAGFGVDEIAITGQSLAKESDIAAALGINEQTNSFNFDVDAARLRVLEIPAIADVSVRKIYPSRLIVEVSEVIPVARWRVDGVTFVVDGAGVQIADATTADDYLPLVIGDGAADDALAIIRALEMYPLLSEGLLALSRIADRRWDMIYDTGLRVQLPETGLGNALAQIEQAQSEFALLERDLVLIDMRVPGFTALRPAQTNDNMEQ